MIRKFICKLFKKSILLFALLTSYKNVLAQNHFLGDLSIGCSSISGYALSAGFAYERNKNQFSLRGTLNKEIGNSKKNGLWGSSKANDRFSEVSIMYGRAIRIKKWFYGSLSAGPSYYGYVNRWFAGSAGFFRYYLTASDYNNGVGLALQLESIFIIDNGTGIGISAFGNINVHKTLAGVTLNRVFGVLGDD